MFDPHKQKYPLNPAFFSLAQLKSNNIGSMLTTIYVSNDVNCSVMKNILNYFYMVI